MTDRPWPYQRGFSAIGLFHPKDRHNVGGALRAAWCYGASLVAVAGARNFANEGIQHSANTMKSWRHVPVLTGDDLHDLIPFDCIPVAVDLIEGAVPLPNYQHPQRAFYVFGPEDGTLGRNTLEWCRDRVVVPTRLCMNLAATVNVVLYDRIAKAMRSARKGASV